MKSWHIKLSLCYEDIFYWWLTTPKKIVAFYFHMASENQSANKSVGTKIQMSSSDSARQSQANGNGFFSVVLEPVLIHLMIDFRLNSLK